MGEHAFAGEYESRGIRPSGIRLEADVVERIDQLEVLRQTRLSLIDRGERVIVHCGRTIVVVVELDEADRDSNQVRLIHGTAGELPYDRQRCGIHRRNRDELWFGERHIGLAMTPLWKKA